MEPLLKITTVARTPKDPANQYIRRAGQSPNHRDADHDIIYNNSGANPTAFQLIKRTNGSRNYFRFPLTVQGRFRFPAKNADYTIVATAGRFRLTTLPFPVNGTGAEIAFAMPAAFFADFQDSRVPSQLTNHGVFTFMKIATLQTYWHGLSP